MKTFKTLAEVVEYIKDGEDASGYCWNNDGGIGTSMTFSVMPPCMMSSTVSIA